jgi:hypothetical protein
MGRFKKPPDAEVGFRLTVTPSFAAPFVMRAWGAGKWGWFTATCRNAPPVPEGIRGDKGTRTYLGRNMSASPGMG